MPVSQTNLVPNQQVLCIVKDLEVLVHEGDSFAFTVLLLLALH